MENPPTTRPKGGIGVFVIDSKRNKVLIGKRKDNDLFAQPGGWLEFGEEFEECGSRELKEEVGLDVPPERVKFLKTYNCYDPSRNYHNVAIYLLAELYEHELCEIKNCEPDKCEEWVWVDFSFIKDNIEKFFFPVKVFLEKLPEIKTALDLKGLI